MVTIRMTSPPLAPDATAATEKTLLPEKIDFLLFAGRGEAAVDGSSPPLPAGSTADEVALTNPTSASSMSPIHSGVVCAEARLQRAVGGTCS